MGGVGEGRGRFEVWAWSLVFIVVVMCWAFLEEDRLGNQVGLFETTRRATYQGHIVSRVKVIVLS